MASRPPRRDAKAEALRAQGALHPRPDAVRDPLFGSHDFFDARDLVQVKYEMLRRVEVDGHSVAQTTDAFGCSRPTFYQAQTAFKAHGLPGLVPRKRGPRGAHKLDDAVMAVVRRLPHRRPRRSARRRCSATFGGALGSPSTGAPSSAPSGARKKNGADRRHAVVRGGVPIPVLVTSYETLRRVALGHSGPDDGPSLGFTLLLRQGMAAWLRAWAMCPGPAVPAPAAVPLSAIPPLVHHELAQVWAHMVLLHQEVTWT